MIRLAQRLLPLLLAGLLAAPLAAQVAQGSETRLLAISLAGAGGPAAAADTTSDVALGEVAGGHMSSPGFRASVGFLAAGEPHDHTAPTIIGIHPPFSRHEGGAKLSIYGRNFDTWQEGASLTVKIGGKVCSDVTVVTPSMITGIIPPGDPGPAELVVSTSLGTTLRKDGFFYTPALFATGEVVPGAKIDLKNVGPTGDRFVTYVSVTTQQVHTRLGTLLIGPQMLQLFQPRRYPGPVGTSHITFRVPKDAALVGLSLYFQSLSTGQKAPHASVLTNSATVSIP